MMPRPNPRKKVDDAGQRHPDDGHRGPRANARRLAASAARGCFPSHVFHDAEKLNWTGAHTVPPWSRAVRVFPQYSLTAEMSIEKAPAGAWTGKLVTGATRGSVDVIPPKHKDAQALYQSWTTAARADGKIPGGVIAILADSVKTFIKNNPTWKTTPQLEKMLPRFDASRDWTGPDAVTLLNELAAMQDTPITMAARPRSGEHHSRGRAAAAGAGERALGRGAAERSAPGVAAGATRRGAPARHAAEGAHSFPQRGEGNRRIPHAVVASIRGIKARDAKGAEINVESTSWTTIGRLVTFQLAPGEFVEVNATGIGIGASKNAEDWQDAPVGSWVEAKEGDDVTVTTEPVPLSDWNEKPQLDGEPRWWLDHIKARLSRHLPFPRRRRCSPARAPPRGDRSFGHIGQQGDERRLCRRHHADRARFAGEAPFPSSRPERMVRPVAIGADEIPRPPARPRRR